MQPFMAMHEVNIHVPAPGPVPTTMARLAALGKAGGTLDLASNELNGAFPGWLLTNTSGLNTKLSLQVRSAMFGGDTLQCCSFRTISTDGGQRLQELRHCLSCCRCGFELHVCQGVRLLGLQVSGCRDVQQRHFSKHQAPTAMSEPHSCCPRRATASRAPQATSPSPRRCRPRPQTPLPAIPGRPTASPSARLPT